MSHLSVALFFLFAVSFAWSVSALRPDIESISVTIGADGLLPSILALVATTAVVLVLHEATHGLCFWLFTRERPRYGFRGLYAYAAAPDWYIARLEYAIIGAAPLVLLSLGGLLLALMVPADALLLVLYALAINAAGAIGDILVLGWVAVSLQGSLFCDRGDAIERFVPAD